MIFQAMAVSSRESTWCVRWRLCTRCWRDDAGAVRAREGARLAAPQGSARSSLTSDSLFQACYRTASFRQCDQDVRDTAMHAAGKHVTTGALRASSPQGAREASAGQSREGRRGGGTGHRKRRLTARISDRRRQSAGISTSTGDPTQNSSLCSYLEPIQIPRQD